MTRRLQILFIIILVITSFSFFGANFIDKRLNNYLNFFFTFIAFALSLPFFFPKKKGFVFPVQLIVISIIVSVFMSYYSWDQDIKSSIPSTLPFLLWIFFFFLLQKDIPIKVIENIVLVYGVVYIALYFFQFLRPDTIFFGVVGEDGKFDTERGIVRIIFPGGGIFFLSVFMGLNKLTTQKEKRWVWVTLTILGAIIPIMQATRQFIVGVFIMYVIHFTKGMNVFKKAVLISCFIGLFSFISDLDLPVIKGLLAAQEETKELGNDNIRMLAADYFLKDFSPNTASMLLGNGVPAGPTLSTYGQFVAALYDEGFFMEDLGLIGLYTLFGIFAILGYVLIWINTIVIKLPKEYYYLRYYLWFLLITSLTSNSLYHPYYLVPTVFALYIYQTIHLNQTQTRWETS